MAFDNISKALADNYEKQFQINEDLADEDYDRYVTHTVDNYLNSTAHICEANIDPNEVCEIMNKLKK